MIDYLILSDDDGGKARLTTESSASSYGIPVLVLDADDIRGDDPERTEDERTAARRYLRQWPDGPQIGGA